VIREADVCVLGGSCTGVFAAIRAARLGMRVLLIEKEGMLGGSAVTGLVNIWHTLMDTDDREQIIAGLTYEVICLLKARGALTVQNNRSSTYNFNPMELAILLDELIRENRIDLMLHTSYSAVSADGDEVKAVIIENKDGRSAVKASFFIDATGDGMAARDLGLPVYAHEYIQPPTPVFHLQGNLHGVDVDRLIREHGAEFGLPDDWGWNTHVAGLEGISMRADQHIFGVRCDRADDLTRAETEGRRLIRGLVSLLNAYGRSDAHYAISAMCSSLGIRETVHVRTRFCATETALLTGERYAAPVLNGTYPVDVHHHDDGGISFKYLDGSRTTIWGKGTRTETGNWREEAGLTEPPAKYYQGPFDILVGEKYGNFAAAGRMVNADAGAFGALRVMVNLNQLGEAAGTAAALCLERGVSVRELDGVCVTETLRKGGSAV
jgi:hypothetical protein